MTRTANISLIFLILLILSSGCFEERLGEIVYEEYVPPTPPPADGGGIGLEIYKASCSGCHALSGKGAGMPNIPDLTDPAFWDTNPDDLLTESIKKGISGTPMPGFEDSLSDEEVAEVIKYMRTFAG